MVYLIIALAVFAILTAHGYNEGRNEYMQSRKAALVISASVAAGAMVGAVLLMYCAMYASAWCLANS